MEYFAHCRVIYNHSNNKKSTSFIVEKWLKSTLFLSKQHILDGEKSGVGEQIEKQNGAKCS